MINRVPKVSGTKNTDGAACTTMTQYYYWRFDALFDFSSASCTTMMQIRRTNVIAAAQAGKHYEKKTNYAHSLGELCL